MKYAMMMAFLVGCGDADPKPQAKKEAPKKEVAKPAPKAEAKKEAPKAEAKPAEKPADKTEAAPEAAPEANVSTARTGEQVYTRLCNLSSSER